MRCPLLLPLTCPGSRALHGAPCLHHRELSESGEARAGRKSFVVRILISILDPVSFSLGQLTFTVSRWAVFSDDVSITGAFVIQMILCLDVFRAVK